MGSEDLCGFPAFIPNAKDKLHLFNDAGCHTSCVDKHSFGKEALDFADKNYLKFKEKKCWASGTFVAKMEDFFALPLLTSDASEPLFKYNFLILNRNNIFSWEEREEFIGIVTKFIADGKWEDLMQEYRFWDSVLTEIK
jgi:hypothetical protein